MPYRQLVDELKPYELKSRFAFLYDAYLVDGMIYGPATKILGTRFFKRGKHLLPVKMNSRDLKRNIERALTKTVMSVHGNGDSFVVKVRMTCRSFGSNTGAGMNYLGRCCIQSGIEDINYQTSKK